MIDMPEKFKNLLSPLASEFKYNTFPYFEAIIKGIILSKRKKNVTKFFALSGLKKHFSNFHRFVNSYNWDFISIGFHFVLTVIDLLKLQEIAVALDDTLITKYGKKIFGCCFHFDHSQKPNRPKYIWGHNWVTMGLLYHAKNFNKWVCLTFLSRLYISQKNLPRHLTYLSRIEIAIEMVNQLKERIKKRIILVADALYAKKTLIQFCMKNSIVFISRMRHDAALYFTPPKPKKRQRGRHRKYGKRLPSLKKMAKDKKGFKRYKVTLYGEKMVIPVRVIHAIWKPAGQMVKILMVDYPKQKSTTFFFCTNLTMKVEKILTLISARWSIEDAFVNLKEHLGLKDWQCRKNMAVNRSATLNCLAYSYLLIWSIQNNSGNQIDGLYTIPWYQHKKRISLIDIMDEFKNQCLEKVILSSLSNNLPNYKKIKQIKRVFKLAA